MTAVAVLPKLLIAVPVLRTNLVSWSVLQNTQFEDQPDADCTLSQFAGIDISDEMYEKRGSNPCELGAYFELYSSGRSKKRPRIDIEEILNENISKVSNTMNEDPLFRRPTKSPKKGNRALKHFREIVGREGCDPINYIDFIIRREETRRKTLVKSDDQKERARQRHDLGVRARHSFTPGQLVMLWDGKTAGTKLRASSRGPFYVTGY